jgi:hypothetical protein
MHGNLLKVVHMEDQEREENDIKMNLKKTGCDD